MCTPLDTMRYNCVLYHTCTNGVYGKYGYDHRPDRNVGIAELHVNIEIT